MRNNQHFNNQGLDNNKPTFSSNKIPINNQSSLMERFKMSKIKGAEDKEMKITRKTSKQYDDNLS